jgi:hypothetical protein
MEKEWEMSNPLTVFKSLGSGKSEVQGVVKRDWVPTGRIDFATKISLQNLNTRVGKSHVESAQLMRPGQ